MYYIMTKRGWQPLHKRHYETAQSWLEKGLNVDEQVATLGPLSYWISETNFSHWEVMTRLVYGARQRARRDGVPCDISETDCDIPKVCPLRNVPFKVGRKQHGDDSPTLDRKDPRLGYVKGNVWVISHKANRLKGDMTPNELRTFCENVLELNWVLWTKDDDEELRARELERKRQLNDKEKPRWWALHGRDKAKVGT